MVAHLLNPWYTALATCISWVPALTFYLLPFLKFLYSPPYPGVPGILAPSAPPLSCLSWGSCPPPLSYLSWGSCTFLPILPPCHHPSSTIRSYPTCPGVPRLLSPSSLCDFYFIIPPRHHPSSYILQLCISFIPLLHPSPAPVPAPVPSGLPLRTSSSSIEIVEGSPCQS